MKGKCVSKILVVLSVFIAVFFAVNVNAQENNTKKQDSATANLEKKDVLKPEGMKIFVERLDLNLPEDREVAAGALWYATMAGGEETVQVLLDKGVDVNTQTPYNKLTPLHIAVQGNDTKMVKFLISKGADVNAKYFVPRDYDFEYEFDNMEKFHNIENLGLTPLCMAAAFNSVESAKILLKNGANVNGENNLGTTPLDMAKSNKMKKLLIKYGAIDEKGSMKIYKEGVEFYKQGNYKKAKAKFQEALKVYPNNTDATLGLLKIEEVENKK